MIWKKNSNVWWSYSSFKKCDCDAESNKCKHFKRIDDHDHRILALFLIEKLNTTKK
jgi:hypothetical protein